MNGLELTLELGRPHSPSQEWTQRLPSPPRINVPPPSMDRIGLPDLGIMQGSVDFDATGFPNVAFLSQVTHGNIIYQNNMIDWKYEQRHQAQRILPFLYLGPVAAARDVAFLQRSGITMVVAVRYILSAHARLLGSKAAVNLGIQLKYVDVSDNQELIAALPSAIDMINSHLFDMYQLAIKHNPRAMQASGASSPGKVLVFCESGNERSAILVIAYIMAMYSMDLVRVIQLVQAQRFAVSIDDETRTYLETYDHMLRAKRDVLRQHTDISTFHASVDSGRHFNNPNTPRLSIKRTLEDTFEDKDVDMDSGMGNDDHERFEKREGLAPFHD